MSTFWKHLFLFLLFLASVLSWARDKQDNWVELTSPHFVVYSNASEKDARRVADQFERMRLVFQTAFPKLNDSGARIVVLAVKDAKSFRALEPEAYLAKGQMELAGLFLRTADKNYVLLRMDAGGPHPYATIYHEYTHYLLSGAEWLPLWLNEGLAEFYQNTEIRDKNTTLGEPSSDDLIWLQQNRLLPLSTLFAVDHNSPYYHEEKKGSIFYAESWALTHYLQTNDFRNNTTKLRDYLVLVSNHVDPVTAASQSFGDLKQLQNALDGYIRQFSFTALKLTKELPVNDATFKVDPVTPVQADAVRADFLAYNSRDKDARALLDEVLREDPNNTLAHETMGFLEFRNGNLEKAEDWYRQAVKLDSHSYLAHYYFATMALRRHESGDELGQEVEASLRNCIKLNPSFAPAYDSLALFFASQYKNLDEAHMLTLQAVSLDPDNVYYRINAASVLLAMKRDADADRVLEAALKIAKTPQQTSIIETQISNLQAARAAMKDEDEREQHYQQVMTASKEEERTPEAASYETDPPQTGPRRTAVGTIKNVRCAPPAKLDFDLEAAGKTLSLHSSNYYKVQFTALNFTPSGELQPCTSLEGMKAKLEYIEDSARKSNGLVGVELRK